MVPARLVLLLLQPLRDAVAVDGSKLDDLQDQQIQRALGQVGVQK